MENCENEILRHEIKHEINVADMYVIRQRLKSVMKADSHAENGKYLVRSLYFDDPFDSALMSKISGDKVREKYRIRMYNFSSSFIRLERKFKNGGLGKKDSALLTKEQTLKIINSDIDWMKDSDNEVILNFYGKLKNKLLKPKVIVDYIREPFVFPAGNVRVTLDYDIRTCLESKDFFNENCVSIPVKENSIILEVKWDAFLPDIVRDAVGLSSRRAGAYSKYAASRMYG